MTAHPTDLLSRSSGSALERQLSLVLRAEAAGKPWCKYSKYKELLRQADLRPTRQRLALSWILFSNGHRHVTAETLYEEATEAKIPVSMATVYNTLHQFAEAGLLRQVGVGSSKSFFDTDLTKHHHFFVPDEDALLDIPPPEALLDRLPQAPDGFEITHVDVVVRLRRKRG
jgi:Fur family iron response transcriptional regulator